MSMKMNMLASVHYTDTKDSLLSKSGMVYRVVVSLSYLSGAGRDVIDSSCDELSD